MILERNERGSLIITANLPFGEWTKVFSDPRLTKAVDRPARRRAGGRGRSYEERLRSSELAEERAPGPLVLGARRLGQDRPLVDPLREDEVDLGQHDDPVAREDTPSAS